MNMIGYRCFACSAEQALDYDGFLCPECGGSAYNFGRHFKSPKKTDAKQWKKIRFLFDNGIRFQKIRPIPNSTESIPYPDTLEEARGFVVKYKDFSWPSHT